MGFEVSHSYVVELIDNESHVLLEDQRLELERLMANNTANLVYLKSILTGRGLCININCILMDSE